MTWPAPATYDSRGDSRSLARQIATSSVFATRLMVAKTRRPVPRDRRSTVRRVTRLREITSEPRRYGFHDTLKPPFALAPGVSATMLLDEVRTFAEARSAVIIGAMKVAVISDFIALSQAEARNRRSASGSSRGRLDRSAGLSRGAPMRAVRGCPGTAIQPAAIRRGGPRRVRWPS